MFLIGLLTAALAGALNLYSAVVLSRANPAVRIPAWTGAPVNPVRALVGRAIGAATAVLSISWTQPSIGFWSVAIVLAVVGIPWPVLAWHNRRVAAGV